ncbi:MAG TPA: AraC family transcriptional regulator [Hyphomonadaceae bacterium]|nr:AraC family transcriptional regulator [Hyphomonadaceae bacterium]
MHGTTGSFSELLLGLCAGALFAMAAAMLRAPRPAARWTGFAFFLTSAFFAIKLWCDSTQAFPSEIRMVVGVTAMTSVGWFWLMVMALFDDKDEFRPVMFAAPAGLFLFGILHQLPPGAVHPVAWSGSILLQVGLAIASLMIVLRSWKNDLVESRRRIRGPFMIAVSLYILSLNGFDLWEMFGDTPAWYPMFNAIMLAGCVLAGSFAFLEARGAMFGAETAAALPVSPAVRTVPAEHAGSANGRSLNGGNGGSATAFDRTAKADLDRLELLMSTQQVWKEEGLTIASLALRANVPESQLRRLINDRLGYRNFPSYVNAHRIAAAKSRLSDPNEARVSISTIAYDIGFASLGPFNRAFREETGVAPSEWRRHALLEPSPIPEKA